MAWYIEHPTKGVCTAVPGDRDESYHFAWSIHRDNDRRRDFFQLDHAKKKLVDAPEGSAIWRDNGYGTHPRYEPELR